MSAGNPNSADKVLLQQPLTLNDNLPNTSLLALALEIALSQFLQSAQAQGPEALKAIQL